VTNQAKRMTYEKQIWNSNNKTKTTCKIINKEVHKKVKKDSIQTISTEGKNISNLYTIVEAF
jgi:hypothetical protein